MKSIADVKMTITIEKVEFDKPKSETKKDTKNAKD